MDTAAGFYEQMLARGAGSYVAALDSIVSSDALPAVFYRLAGKDRTGCFAAVVLGLLGVDDETIVADYTLTQDVVHHLTDRRLQRDGLAVEAERWTGIPEDLKEAPARTMEALIEKVHAALGRLARVRGHGRHRRRRRRPPPRRAPRGRLTPPTVTNESYSTSP